MKKQERQRIVRKIIQDNEVYRQEDLVERLLELGIEVTQATVSRDVKELQLIKVPTKQGSYRYSLPTAKNDNIEKKLKKLLSDAYLGSKTHRDMCMLKVSPGNGPVLASLISQMKYTEVFSTLGDDDTVMLFAYSDEAAKQIEEKLLLMLQVDD
ncbi:arginine repressor [Ligilactobacillus faecis]|uniref:Arginine repressor n=1 Tax=Ligilactobacillus faecis TaxID=762833 RepID=A0ABV4DNI2_9LACO|nr:ArgR family transcriptional regulator [Ligilactobacillus faecis]WGN89062.1 ArgR family transcriptional regulator [Ligilactobacillus faecis]